MKKDYKRPEMDVVLLSTRLTLMAGSVTEDTSTATQKDNIELGARGFFYEDEN